MMHPSQLKIIFIAGILLLSACSLSTENIAKDYKLNPDNGVVVLSLTSSGECGYALFVDIRRIDKKDETTIGLQDLMEDRDWQRKNEDCSIEDENDFYGKLSVVALEPGTYEIYSLSGISRYNAFYSDENFSITFKVKANSVTYLGNAHFIVEKKFFSFHTTDKRKRDLSLFQYKHPGLTDEYIIDLLETVNYQSI